MKKCYACYAMNDDKATVCSKCKFSFPHIVGDPKKFEPILMKAAAEYRKKNMIGVQIGMVTYSYELVDEELQESGQTDVLLVEDISSAKPGDIFWGTEEYARIDAGEEITLSVFVKILDTKKDYELTVVSPETDGLWKIGVKMEEGFSFRVLVGTESSYAQTDTVSVMG